MKRRGAALALLACLCAPAAAQEAAPVTSSDRPAWELDPDEDPQPRRWGRGPLELREPYPLALMRLSPWARSPEVLGHLRFQGALRLTWSNSFGFARNRYLIDGEVRQVDMVVRMGLLDRIELGLLLPWQWRGGGVMDGFIEGFHSAFGLPNGARGSASRDRWTVNGVDPGRRRFDFDRKGTGFGDLIGEARVLLTEGGDLLPAATAGLRVRFPTGARKFDLSDGVDVSLSIDLSQRIGGLRSPFIAYLGGAWTWHAQTRINDLIQARNRGMFYLGLEVELADWVSLVVHAWIESKRETRLFRDLNVTDPTNPLFNTDLDFGNWITYMTAGFKVEPVDGLVIELGILEDIVDPRITADFGLYFGLSYRI